MTNSTLCDNRFSNLTFMNNHADNMGGAIYYDSYRPSLTNITYANNSALYGQNIASYPIKIIEQGISNDLIELNNIGPSITYSGTLKLALVDYDDQKIMNDVKHF